MSNNTIAILALDAGDLRLLRKWNCNNLLLETHRELETFNYSKEVPHTPEVWTTVATGVGPEEHGVGATPKWDNRVLRAASSVTQFFPGRLRGWLGRPFRDDEKAGVGMSFPQTNHDSVFDPGRVYGWPGLTEGRNLAEAWHWHELAANGDLLEKDLDLNLRGNTGEELGWLRAMADSNVSIIGVHCHALDIAGHVYCKRSEKLRTWYEYLDAEVGRLRQAVDRLLILSDHGIQVEWLDDDDPGVHSWRAFIAAQGLKEPLPKSVFDVRSWLEPQIPDPEYNRERVSLDTPEDRLRDLGYIE